MLSQPFHRLPGRGEPPVQGSGSRSPAGSPWRTGVKDFWRSPGPGQGATFALALPIAAVPRGCSVRMTGQRVLVVDDEPQIRRAPDDARGAGYEVDEGGDRRGGAAAAARFRPTRSSSTSSSRRERHRVCRELRGWTDAPVIVLSAVGEERREDRRARRGRRRLRHEAVRRRRAARAAARRPARRSRERAGDPGREPRIDLAKQAVTLEGARSSPRPHEFDLLRLFAQNQGKLLTHRMILREVWGPAYQTEAHYLHVYISHLRREDRADPAVRGTSYGARRRLPARRSRPFRQHLGRGWSFRWRLTQGGLRRKRCSTSACSGSPQLFRLMFAIFRGLDAPDHYAECSARRLGRRPRLPRLRPVPWREALGMTGQGIGPDPLSRCSSSRWAIRSGFFMARVYSDQRFRARGWLGGLKTVERGFYRVVRW